MDVPVLIQLQIAVLQSECNVLQAELDGLNVPAIVTEPSSTTDQQDALDAYMHEVNKADQSAVKGALDVSLGFKFDVAIAVESAQDAAATADLPAPTRTAATDATGEGGATGRTA